MMFAKAKGRFGASPARSSWTTRTSRTASVDVRSTPPASTLRDEKRDGHLKSADFFDVENYPVATFRSTRVEADGDDLKVTGDLTIKGVTRPVVLDAGFNGQGTNPWGQPVLSYSATAKFNRTHFGLNYNAALETGGVLVGEEVTLSIEIEANS